MARDGSPPRWLERATFVALAALLYFPLHVRYQNPDQDYPALALFELVRGGWAPWSLHYPSALNNLLRAGYALALLGARLAGHHLDAGDLLAAWSRDPAPFRILPRFIAMTGGAVSLVAVARPTALATDRWSGLLAAVLLGTSYMFVREHHHGMYDAPASAAAAVSLALAARYVRRPAAGVLAGAAAAAALATSFKYNAAVTLVSPLLALGLAPPPAGGRTRAVVAAACAAGATLFVTSPAVFLQPAQLVVHLWVLRAAYRGLAGRAVAYGFLDVLRNGLGLPLLAVAAAGAAMMIRRRERALVPLLAFAAVYGALAWQNPLPLNRYALPLAPPVALLAACGLHWALPTRLRVVAAAALVALGLSSSLQYLSLIGREDTRVAAARWLRAHVRPDARVFLPGNVMTAGYVGPDLPRAFVLPEDLSPATLEVLRMKLSPPFPHTWRFFAPPGDGGGSPAGPERLAPWSNAIVVTSELREGPFAGESTPAAAIADLERWAVLLADYPVEREADRRAWEPDLNYAPMRGMATLLRPGPRLRVWYVPKRDASPEPSPWVAGDAP